MTKQPFEYDDESFDFGFTTVSEQDFKIKETTVVQQVTKEVTEASNVKVERIYKMIMPLLLNLKKDADKNEYIYWPNRGKKIDEFVAILDKLVHD
jgi:hypothetical protein